MHRRMLKFAASSSPAGICRSPAVRACRRCLSQVAGLSRQRQQQPVLLRRSLLQLHPRHSAMLQPAARSFVTLDSLRGWFTEGPEAAVPSTPPTSTLPLDEALRQGSAAPPPTGSSSFFVEDAPAAIQELIEGSSADTLADAASSLAEPTFTSLGLGTGLWPSSLQLKWLETLHVTLDMPWWLCAIVMGVGVRLILLLPNMYLQRLLRVDLPRMMNLQNFMERMRFCDRSGNMHEALRLQQEALEKFPELIQPAGMRKFMRRNMMTMGANFFAMSFIQLASIRAIYQATALPVESFQQGGFLWLMDLTCIDPYFLLPATITGLLMLNVRQYFSTQPPGSQQVAMAKPLAYTLLPAFVFTCLVNFPGANLFYFFATGSTAQLIYRFNRTEVAKTFWKSRIGLPRLEDLPPPPAQTGGAIERIRNQIMPAIDNKEYQATRMPDQADDSQAPKTYRIRRKQQLRQSSRII